MPGEALIGELDGLIAVALARIGKASAEAPVGEGVTVARLLEIALKNELEASEEAALWMVGERDVAVKLALARQCGDEAKHYRLIEDRLRALGRDTAAIDPLAAGYSPMFQYLRGLTTTVERIAAGQFAREALAKVRNEVFADFCAESGDAETARLYREIILPDEGFHHEMGRRLLPRFVRTEEEAELARRAARRTLELAEELQEIARMKQGLCRLPGC
jgi:hypothetical protein